MISIVRRFYIVTAVIFSIFIGELIYFSSSNSTTPEELKIKRNFVYIVGLPDLSIATEARFIRYRTLSDVYSPFNEGPEILDYFPASFTYYPAIKEGK
jgi:hypothetical protein